MTNNTSLTILSTAIRQDAEGRYCLNDCHRASGAEKKDGPSYWLATKDSEKLVEKLNEETAGMSVVTVEGRNGGTFVAKELVYAYAMWISADFSLTVIRAFDAMVRGAAPNILHRLPQSRIPAIRSANALFGSAMAFNRRMGMDKPQARLKALARVKDETGLDLVEIFGFVEQVSPRQVKTLTATDIGVLLRLGPSDVNKLLAIAELLTEGRDKKGKKVWVPTEKAERFGRLCDVSKAYASGTTQQWRWYPEVVDFIRPFAQAPEAAL